MGFVDFVDKGFEDAVKTVLGTTKERLAQEDINVISGILVNKATELGLPVPWLIDTMVFNMPMPQLIFNVGDSENGLWEQDLRHFSHIKVLCLYAGSIDLSFMCNFRQINQLTVAHNSTKDWSFLRELVNLRVLFVQDAPSFNLGDLRDLVLEQEKAAATCKDPLFWQYQLENIRLVSCGIKDISPLANFRCLSELELSNNEITDFSPVLDLPLHTLTLRHNRLSDLSFINRKSNIECLDLRQNEIRDISPLANMVNLKELYMGQNPITDFSTLDRLNIRQHDVDGYIPSRKI